MKKFAGYIEGDKKELVNLYLKDGFITLEFKETGNNPSISFEALSDLWEMCKNSGVYFSDKTKKEIEEEMLNQPPILLDIEPEKNCSGCSECSVCEEKKSN